MTRTNRRKSFSLRTEDDLEQSTRLLHAVWKHRRCARQLLQGVRRSGVSLAARTAHVTHTTDARLSSARRRCLGKRPGAAPDHRPRGRPGRPGRDSYDRRFRPRGRRHECPASLRQPTCPREGFGADRAREDGEVEAFRPPSEQELGVGDCVETYGIEATLNEGTHSAHLGPRSAYEGPR